MSAADDDLSTVALFGLMLGAILLPVAVIQVIADWPMYLPLLAFVCLYGAAARWSR